MGNWTDDNFVYETEWLNRENTMETLKSTAYYESLIEITGSDATFEVNNFDAIPSQEGLEAKLGFIADENGVSAIKANGRVTLDPKATTLEVDLAKIGATTQSLTLIDAIAVKGTFAGASVNYGTETLNEASSLETLGGGEYFVEYTKSGEVVIHFNREKTAIDSIAKVTHICYSGEGQPVGGNDGGDVQGVTFVDGKYGTLEIHPDGTFTYDLDETVVESITCTDAVYDQFTYTIGVGDTEDVATLTFNVSNSTELAISKEPVIRYVEYIGHGFPCGNNPGSADVDGPTAVDGQYGTLVIHPDGSYSYDLSEDAKSYLTADDNVIDEFAYEIQLLRDGEAVLENASLTVRING